MKETHEDVKRITDKTPGIIAVQADDRDLQDCIGRGISRPGQETPSSVTSTSLCIDPTGGNFNRDFCTALESLPLHKHYFLQTA